MNLRRLFTPLAIALLGVGVVFAEPTVSVEQAATASNAFALDLFAQLSNQSGNIIVSPFSVDTALAMANVGARGETADEIANTLHLPVHDTSAHAALAALMKQLNQSEFDGGQLEIANSLWAQKGYPFKKSFQGLLQDEYGASLNITDLTGWPGPFDATKAAGARRQIDLWVGRHTHGKISDILPQEYPDYDTRLILANTIYFKGIWMIPFNRAQTQKLSFYVSDGQAVQIPMMHVEHEFNYAKTSNAQVLQIPYKGGRLSMVVFLPNDRNSLSSCEQGLTTDFIAQVCKALSPSEMSISLPKFEGNSGFDLKHALMAMGLKSSFTDFADFSGITTAKPFFIQTVLHKASIVVDENGTEIVASTGIGLGDSIMRPFNVDHPFLFVVRDNATGVILFIGRIMNPLQD